METEILFHHDSMRKEFYLLVDVFAVVELPSCIFVLRCWDLLIGVGGPTPSFGWDVPFLDVPCVY